MAINSTREKPKSANSFKLQKESNAVKPPWYKNVFQSKLNSNKNKKLYLEKILTEKMERVSHSWYKRSNIA